MYTKRIFLCSKTVNEFLLRGTCVRILLYLVGIFCIPVQSIIVNLKSFVCTSVSDVFQRTLTFYQDSRYQTDYYISKHSFLRHLL